MMWISEAKSKSTATKEEIWAIYLDVVGWKNWDSELAFSQLDGPFVVGSTGKLKPRKGPLTHFTVTEVSVNQSFESVAVMPHRLLPLVRLAVKHQLTSLPDGNTQILHCAQVSGVFGPLAARLMGTELSAGLKAATSKLAKHALSNAAE